MLSYHCNGRQELISDILCAVMAALVLLVDTGFIHLFTQFGYYLTWGTEVVENLANFIEAVVIYD